MKELQAQFIRTAKEIDFTLPSNNTELSILNSQEYTINVRIGRNDDYELFQLEDDSPRYLLLFSWNRPMGYCGVAMYTIDDDYSTYETCDEHQIFLQYDWEVEAAGIDIDDEESIISGLKEISCEISF